MANGPGQAVELQELSCNWKRLKESLKSDETRPRMHKAPSHFSQPNLDRVKQRKLRHAHAIHTKPTVPYGSVNMGLNWSSRKDDAPSASLALWAEDNDISRADLAAAYGSDVKSTTTLEPRSTADKINEGLSQTSEAGKYIAIDCEMVGVGPTPDTESALARVSIVNYHGHQIYDSFVRPKETVTDYRTFVSGVTPELLKGARSLEVVQAEVARILDGKILIGHAIKNDLGALFLKHSKRDIRDTSSHRPFRTLVGGKTPGLKRLARQVLGVDIQMGEHSSIEDARTTMLLFRSDKQGFENEHLKKWGSEYKKSSKMAADEAVKGPGMEKKKHRKKKKIKK